MRSKTGKQREESRGLPGFFCGFACVFGFREKLAHRPPELIKPPIPVARHENKKIPPWGWTSRKKSHLESGLNQQDRAKSSASYIKSFVKKTATPPRFVGCFGRVWQSTPAAASRSSCCSFGDDELLTRACLRCAKEPGARKLAPWDTRFFLPLLQKLQWSHSARP